jgi:hypothetical protein
MREQTIEKMLNEGFEPVNLKAGNVQVGSAVVNRNVMFGTVKIIKDKISKFGVSIRIYGVRFDEDYQDDPLTFFTANNFEEFFLVDKRKKV